MKIHKREQQMEPYLDLTTTAAVAAAAEKENIVDTGKRSDFTIEYECICECFQHFPFLFSSRLFSAIVRTSFFRISFDYKIFK